MALTTINKAEKVLHDLFKGVPALPKSGKDIVTQLTPLLAGIAALLYLWSSVTLFNVARQVSELQAWLYSYAITVGPTSAERILLYIAAVVSLIMAFMLGWAVPKLINRAREGWRLLFTVALIGLVMSIFSLFLYNYGFGSFLFGLLGSAVTFYLLLQIKGHFTAKDGARKRPVPQATADKKKE